MDQRDADIRAAIKGCPVPAPSLRVTASQPIPPVGVSSGLRQKSDRVPQSRGHHQYYTHTNMIYVHRSWIPAGAAPKIVPSWGLSGYRIFPGSAKNSATSALAILPTCIDTLASA